MSPSLSKLDAALVAAAAVAAAMVVAAGSGAVSTALACVSQWHQTMTTMVHANHCCNYRITIKRKDKISQARPTIKQILEKNKGFIIHRCWG